MRYIPKNPDFVFNHYRCCTCLRVFHDPFRNEGAHSIN